MTGDIKLFIILTFEIAGSIGGLALFLHLWLKKNEEGVDLWNVADLKSEIGIKLCKIFFAHKYFELKFIFWVLKQFLGISLSKHLN